MLQAWLSIGYIVLLAILVLAVLLFSVDGETIGLRLLAGAVSL